MSSFLLLSIVIVQTVAVPSEINPVGTPLEEVVRLADHGRRRMALCGPISAARFMSAFHFQVEIDYEGFASKFEDVIDDRGVPVQSVVESIQRELPHARAVTFASKEEIYDASLPIILIVREGRHCVVLEEIDQQSQTATVFDPGVLGTVEAPLSVLFEGWTGNAIISEIEFRSYNRELIVFFSVVNASLALRLLQDKKCQRPRLA